MIGSIWFSVLGNLSATSSPLSYLANAILDIYYAPSPYALTDPYQPIFSNWYGQHGGVDPFSSKSVIEPLRMTSLVAETKEYELDFAAVQNASQSFSYYLEPILRGVLQGSDYHDLFGGTVLDDVYFGKGGDDNIIGGSGADRLNGGSGDDMLLGGSGQDILEGGTGSDVLIGGADIDVFIFRKGSGETRIEDFVLGFDVLDLEDFDVATSQAFEALIGYGEQQGNDVVFDVNGDVLVLANAELANMVADDLCIR